MRAILLLALFAEGAMSMSTLATTISRIERLSFQLDRERETFLRRVRQRIADAADPLSRLPSSDFAISKECAIAITGATEGIGLEAAAALATFGYATILCARDATKARAAVDYIRAKAGIGAVVATVMSNMGLERFLAARGLGLLRTAVGDRYVGEKMREAGCNLGGEQSGHMIMPEFGTTGDGLIAALQVLSVLVEDKRPASEVLRCFTPLPQRLVNVRYAGASPLVKPVVTEAIAAEETALGARGRVLIRASGTEPVIRVMAEAEDTALVDQIVDGLVAEITSAAR